MDSKAAYYYAWARRRRCPEIESIVITSTEYAYLYARDIVKGRWPEGEAIISKDSRSAFHYARTIVKGRWPLGEPVIALSPMYAYLYARDIVRGRWTQAEGTIKRDEVLWMNYVDRFIADTTVDWRKDGF